MVKEPPKVTSWITCDRDIDPGWIESLNSVLSKEKGHSGWYWVVIRITDYVRQQEGEKRLCVHMCVIWLRTFVLSDCTEHPTVR